MSYWLSREGCGLCNRNEIIETVDKKEGKKKHSIISIYKDTVWTYMNKAFHCPGYDKNLLVVGKSCNLLIKFRSTKDVYVQN